MKSKFEIGTELKQENSVYFHSIEDGLFPFRRVFYNREDLVIEIIDKEGQWKLTLTQPEINKLINELAGYNLLLDEIVRLKTDDKIPT